MPWLRDTSGHGDLPGLLRARKGRREEHGASFSEDVAFELAHSDGRILARGGLLAALWEQFGSLFSLSVHERPEVTRDTHHLAAAHRPRSSFGPAWSIFYAITGKPNWRSIDFKFLSNSFT